MTGMSGMSLEQLELPGMSCKHTDAFLEDLLVFYA